MDRTGGYVHSGDDTVEQKCDHCAWNAVAQSYPTVIKRYQDHLRENHPTVWMRR